MKVFRNLLLLTVFVFVSSALTAQNKSMFAKGGKVISPVQKEAQAMAEHLGLNDDQTQALIALEEATRIKRKETREKAAEQSATKEEAKAARKAGIKAVNQEYRKELKKILTPEQLAQWREKRKADRLERQAIRKEKN